MDLRYLLVTALLACAACSNPSTQNQFLDAGEASRGQGESCSRDEQCVAPYRCVAYVCGTVPDAGVIPDASVPASSSSVGASSSVASSVGASSSAASSSGASTSAISSGGASSSLASSGAASTGGSSGAGSSSAATSHAGTSSLAGSGSSGSTSAPASSSSGPTAGALGATCSGDGECASGLCREVFGATDDKVCVTTCTTAGDCGVDGMFFCNPITAGDSNGYCTPRSPAHCATCVDDVDCGRFSEVCVTPPGEGAAVCQVDCSLGGAAACPPDYTCETVTLPGGDRQLCRPDGALCPATEGGFCDRVSAVQDCQTSSPAGTCTGSRTCGEDGRYTACSAGDPVCRATCDTPQPAGCELDPCPEATNTATDCGACGTSCPGAGEETASVACTGGNTCTFACVGENYDVDGSAANGCELEDDPVGNHNQANATDLGAFSCNDGDSAQSVSGSIPADGRTHVPAIPNFSGTTGAAPDWLKLSATGGVCVNDISFTLNVNGSEQADCFRLTVTTDNGSHSCTTSASGTCTVSDGSGSYSDDTTVSFTIEKVCGSAASPESAIYLLTGHL